MVKGDKDKERFGRLSPAIKNREILKDRKENLQWLKLSSRHRYDERPSQDYHRSFVRDFKMGETNYSSKTISCLT